MSGAAEIEGLADTPEEAAAMAEMSGGAPTAPEKPVTPATAPATPSPAAEPSAPAAGEQQPAAPAAPSQPEKPRLVPHAALHEERSRRQALEREIAELRGGGGPQQQPPGQGAAADGDMPDETTDPIGTIAWLKGQLRDQRKREVAAHQEATRINDLGTRVRARVDAYVAEHPEYIDQVQYLRQSRYQELRHLGYGDQEIAQQIMAEEMAIGQRAIDRDEDPGAIVANLAKHRGWQAKAKPGATATPAVAQAEEQIDRLARGHRAAVSPSGGGGGSPAVEMTLEALADLDGDEFDKAFEKHGKRLMG